MSLFSLGYIALLGLLWAAQWGIGNRNPRAFLLSLAARLGLVVWSTLMRVPAIVPVSLAFVVVDWRNYSKWRKERGESNKVAAFIVADALDIREAAATVPPPVETVPPPVEGDLLTLGGAVVPLAPPVTSPTEGAKDPE